MDLRSKHGHMAGKSIRVNGTDYKITDEGVAEGVSEEHAAKLLQNHEGWVKHSVERAPVRSPPPRASAPPPVPPPDPEPVSEDEAKGSILRRSRTPGR